MALALDAADAGAPLVFFASAAAVIPAAALIGDLPALALIINNLGITNLNLGRPREALQLHKAALAMARRIRHLVRVASRCSGERFPAIPIQPLESWCRRMGRRCYHLREAIPTTGWMPCTPRASLSVQHGGYLPAMSTVTNRATAGVEAEQLLRMYRGMIAIRLFDDRFLVGISQRPLPSEPFSPRP